MLAECEDLISYMLNLEQTFDSCQCRFTRRMGNGVAHPIAKEAVKVSDVFTWEARAPVWLVSCLQMDENRCIS